MWMISPSIKWGLWYLPCKTVAKRQNVGKLSRRDPCIELGPNKHNISYCGYHHLHDL